MNNDFPIYVMGKPSRKHAAKRKIRYLQAVLVAKLGSWVDEQSKQGSMSLYDALHGTTLYSEYMERRRAEQYQATRKLYGL